MLYLANATRQVMRFNFRVPEYNKMICQEIHSGKQEQLDKDLHLSNEQMSAVIEQMERYGFRDVTNINRKLSDFDGMIYSVGKPIPASNIDLANAVLIEKQEKRSADEAVKSALGFDKGTRDKKSGKRLAASTTVEIVQDVGREKPTGNEINMSLSVDNDGHDDLKI